MSAPNTGGFDTFDRLAGSLEDFAAENGHFRATCPAHDGHRPALTVSVEGEPPNRKILIHCHAGCGLQEILDALDMTKSDLFERSREAAGRTKVIATYDYIDLAGNLVTQTTRHYPPKDFRQRRPDENGKWVWGIKDIEPVLYNLPAVTRTVMDGGTVFVVEGEKDCDRANEVLGAIGAFTTCPMGSGKWRESYTQALRGANVVLISDADEPGRKHMWQVAEALLPVAKSVRMLELPGVPEDGGDTSDWLDAGGTLEKFEALVRGCDLFKSDSPMPSESDLNKYLPLLTVGDVKERSGGSQEEGWFCPLLMKRGEITLFGGEAKRSGKTTLYMHALKATHDGKPFFGMPTIPTKSLVLTEQGNNILEATTKAGIQDDDGIYICPFKDVSREKWPELIAKVVETCKANDIGILVIDTFSAFARLRGSDENLSGEILERMEPIIEATRVHDLHVSLLHHTGKDGDIRGSSAFAQEPDIIWTLKRPPGDHGPNVRALEGLGRHESVNTSFNVALEDSGYVVLGTNGQIENRKARSALVKAIPVGRDNAKRRKAVLASLSEVTSASSLQRALEDLIDAHAVREETLKGRGNPKVLWRPDKGVFKADDLFKSNSEGTGESDLNKKEGGSGTVTPLFPEASKTDFEPDDELRLVTTDEVAQEAVKTLAPVTKVALDLETMPLDEGWIFEVAKEYRAWRRGLKSKPKPEGMRSKWDELKAKTYKRYAVDPATARVRLISLATHDGVNEVIDASKVDVAPLLNILQSKTLIIHNASFDLGTLRERYGYVHQGKVLDTQLLYLLHHYAEDGERTEEVGNKQTLPDPTKKKGMTSLATLSEKYLGVTLDKSNQSADWSVPELSADMIRYALEDSRILLDLSAVLIEKLEGLGMKDVLDLESRALPAIVNMERNGFPASVEVAQEMAKKYAAESAAALEKLTSLIPEPTAPDGREWRWTIAEHVRAALRLLGANLDELPKTRTGDPSTAKGALRQITGPQAALEWVETYLNYEALQKQEKDFVNTYAGLIKDGVIRGSYTKTVATGRLSCREPNLQQVPSRGELQTKDGMRVRSIFKAPEGHTFIVADFAQVELLLAATIAGEEAMLDIFREGGDIHAETAAWVLGKPKREVTKAERTLAKALNFGLIYGCSAERLLESALHSYGVEDLTLKKAKQYRKAFFEKYPALKGWHEQVERDCNLCVQHTSTPLGRRRKLPYWKGSSTPAHTVAKNAPVQGAGADAIKLTMAKLFEDRDNCPGNPQLRCSVHDEVVLTVREGHEDAAIAWVSEHMASAEREVVKDTKSPIAVDVEARESW